MTSITSLQNPRIKAALRLRDGRHRQKQGRFLIDGQRELDRATRADIRVIEVFFCPTLYTRQQVRRLASFLADLEEWDVELVEVSKPVFEKMAFGDRAEGVLAVAETPDWRLSEVELPEAALVAVIEGIEKPGNIGAVVRSADGAGVDTVVLADCRTDLLNPNAIRASLGTILTYPAYEATTEKTLQWLRRHELPIYTTRVDGAMPYTQIDFRPGGVIVLGSEDKGLSDAWSGEDMTSVRLPMCGTADSLNISATAAVLFYEALRQRST